MNVTAHSYQIGGKSGNQISASIEEQIRSGRLPAGTVLPAIRALADRLEVSPTTVASAYRSLRVRGLVRAGGRRGTIVNRRPPLATPTLPVAPEGAINLADGNPDPELLPALAPILAKIAGAHQLYGKETNNAKLMDLARRRSNAITSPRTKSPSSAAPSMELSACCRRICRRATSSR